MPPRTHAPQPEDAPATAKEEIERDNFDQRLRKSTTEFLRGTEGAAAADKSKQQ